ncbi:AraC family transcriptional regulator [Mahella australiensis]|nr:AraC family transcriptional regulator [Mahella australiensis]
MVQTICMAFKDINPHVRFANLLVCPIGFCEGPRKIYDHQFLYVHSGHGLIKIGDNEYEASAGDLFFYSPGLIHTMTADNTNPFVLTGIHFDFTKNHTDKLYPIGPFDLASFRTDNITENIQFLDFGGFKDKVSFQDSSRMRSLIMSIVKEYEDQRRYNQTCLDGYFLAFLGIVARYTIAEDKNSRNDNHLVNEIIEYIQIHYDQDITNKQLADIFHFNPNYLNHIMVIHTGVSLHQYLINTRIRRSLDMLLYTDMSISQVSAAVGFSDIHYFSRLFKQRIGYPPSVVKEYIKPTQ